MTKHFNRWHCYDSNNKKVGKRMPLNETPTDLPDHTPWVHGTGPFSAEARQKLTIAMRARYCGVPKSAEQKAKMRAAKLGKPKTPEHIANMKLAQQRRRTNLDWTNG